MNEQPTSKPFAYAQRSGFRRDDYTVEWPDSSVGMLTEGEAKMWAAHMNEAYEAGRRSHEPTVPTDERAAVVDECYGIDYGLTPTLAAVRMALNAYDGNEHQTLEEIQETVRHALTKSVSKAELNARYAGRERGDDYGEIDPRRPDETVGGQVHKDSPYLAEQIKRSQEAIDRWPPDVKAAMGIAGETKASRCGAFETWSGAQCCLYSDHAGDHKLNGKWPPVSEDVSQ